MITPLRRVGAVCAALFLCCILCADLAVGAQQNGYMSRQPAESLPSAPPPMPAIAPSAQYAASQQSAAAPVAAQSSDSSLLSSLPDINLSWKGYFEALAILCFLLALVLGMLYLFKRLSRGGGLFAGSSVPGMKVENRMSLGPKKWLLVVRYLDRRLVLGVTEQNISLIAQIALEEEPAFEHDNGQTASRKKKFTGVFTKNADNDETDSFASFFDKLPAPDKGQGKH